MKHINFEYENEDYKIKVDKDTELNIIGEIYDSNGNHIVDIQITKDAAESLGNYEREIIELAKHKLRYP